MVFSQIMRVKKATQWLDRKRLMFLMWILEWVGFKLFPKAQIEFYKNGELKSVKFHNKRDYHRRTTRWMII